MIEPNAGAVDPTPTASELLVLDEAASDVFVARCNLDNLAGMTFGGQVLGQGLAAAQRTAPDWPASSLTGHFLRPGKIGTPMVFHVHRLSEGRRFASRRVTARQAGRDVFEMICTFHRLEPGVSHQCVAAPEATDPDRLETLQVLAAREAGRIGPGVSEILQRPFPIEVRMVDPAGFLATATAKRDFWFRMPSAAAVSSDQDHQALIAVMTDYWLPGTIAAPHLGRRAVQAMASLNHSLWLHHPARADEWLLYATETPWAGHGRGLAQGRVFDRQGRLVATATQEAAVHWSVPD
jgi:acyl-CoA thioesterase-2